MRTGVCGANNHSRRRFHTMELVFVNRGFVMLDKGVRVGNCAQDENYVQGI